MRSLGGEGQDRALEEERRRGRSCHICIPGGKIEVYLPRA